MYGCSSILSVLIYRQELTARRRNQCKRTDMVENDCQEINAVLLNC